MTDKKQHITELGNPRKPQHEAGVEMLKGMNDSHEAVTEWALSHFQYKENDWALDIGCGGGATLNRLSQRISKGQIIGVDYSKTSVELSSEFNQQDIAMGKMRVIEASVEKLPFEGECFDKAITVESFYFWPNHEDNLKEVRRVLKKGGVFFLVADIYDHEGLSESTIENVNKYKMFNPTIKEYKELLKNAGFKKVIVHTKSGMDWICVEGRK